MSRGDVQTANLFTFSGVITTPSEDVFAEALGADCPFCLKLFGLASNPDDTLKNDKTSFFKAYSSDIDTAVMKIQKCVNGVFVDKHTVIDDTYGTFKDFGVETHDDRNYISLKNIDWTQILIDFSRGEFRLIIETTSILASVITVPDCTFHYNLQTYTADLADGTVFLKTESANLIGDINDQTRVITFPDDWADGIRIPAVFGNNFSEYEEESVRYGDGFEQDLTNDQTEKYILETDRLPAEIHNFVKTNILQSNIIKATDYNTDNANRHEDTVIKRTSSYEPVWHKRVKTAKVIVEFKSAFDNLRALPC